MTIKIWQQMPAITPVVRELFSSQDEVSAQLLFNRGLITAQAAADFLVGEDDRLQHDPFLFRNMIEAVDLVISHIKAGNKIIVYGDYDADGVTAASCLYETLATLHAQVGVYIPDRVSEGYGLNQAAINELVAQQAKLVITVDNGIRDQANVARLIERGVQVIVTDHHVPPPETSNWPQCLIINPMLPNETYPFKYLAGVGVASKFALAIIKRANISDEIKDRLSDRIMDLVALGTVADCVTLLGENRALVKRGLRVMNHTTRIGLQELIKIAKINEEKTLDSWNIGFQLAPRLNAAGRMDHANTAFELMITRDQPTAVKLAMGLNDSNQIRQRITEGIVKQVTATITEQQLADKIIIAVSPSVYGQGESWNEGVIGLAAGRLMERYYLPVLVITGTPNHIKASGRSIEEFHLIEAIELASEHLDKYGGHAAAAGFTITSQANLEAFMTAMKGLVKAKLGDLTLGAKLNIETEISLRQIDMDLWTNLERFAPFGEDNPKPIFVTHGVEVVDLAKLGTEGQHLRLRLRQDQPRFLSAIGFNQVVDWPDLKIGSIINVVYYLELNTFNGRTELQLRLIDLKILS
ncbi:MAG: single-stranded-DNA-specific exonuclease RecJ [Candidatus Falkowbacteria bacterium]